MNLYENKRKYHVDNRFCLLPDRCGYCAGYKYLGVNCARNHFDKSVCLRNLQDKLNELISMNITLLTYLAKFKELDINTNTDYRNLSKDIWDCIDSICDVSVPNE